MASFLGVDQQTPAPALVNVVFPTDIDIVAAAMAKIILSYHANEWDNFLLIFMNQDKARVIGVDNSGITNFLQRYILYSRSIQQSLTENNWGTFADYFQGTYGYSDSDIRDYLQSMLDAQTAGYMKMDIIQPWTYTSTTVTEDITQAAGGAVKTAFPAVSGVLLIGVAIWAGMAFVVPGLLKGKK
jgi:hypothetical protein